MQQNITLLVLKVYDLGRLRNCLIAHKVLHFNHKTNVAHAEMIPHNYIGRNLRNNMNLNTTVSFYSYNKKVTENAAIIWNEIPHNIKMIKSRKIFKDRLTKVYQEMYV